jgi:hypothetical protein
MTDVTAALVVLRPAGGGELGARTITAETVEQDRPAPESVAQARQAFADAGFTVGPVVGLSFSIEGPRDLMERTFPDFREREGTGTPLSLERQPPEVANHIEAVVSEAPPAFGPTDY